MSHNVKRFQISIIQRIKLKVGTRISDLSEGFGRNEFGPLHISQERVELGLLDLAANLRGLYIGM